MIHFACTCGELFDVPASEAGESFQCPTCRRLVDVPLLSDLESINTDGTLKLNAPVDVPRTLVGKMTTFSHQTDMRSGIDDFLKAGVSPDDLAPQNSAPRYDPETGELVTAIEVQPDARVDDPDDIPMASPVLAYANDAPGGHEPRVTLKWWSMPWQLLGGMSLMAMLFVFVIHALIAVMSAVPALNLIMLLPTLGIVIATIAHYCNTIEEIGPHEMDDVPVYLRNLSLSDDIINPFGNFLLAAVYALAPLMIFSACGGRSIMAEHSWVIMAFFGWSGLLFPAILFTAICSGAIQNLMPQHVLSVIIAAPAQYMLATAAFWAASVAYIAALSLMSFAPVSALQTASGTQIHWAAIGRNIGFMCGLFAVAIYLMHLAAAWLGLIYRTHYEKFHWVYQRHEPTHRDDTTAKLLKMHQERQQQQSSETLARLSYIRQADALRHQAKGLPPAKRIVPNHLPQPPRGFEV